MAMISKRISVLRADIAEVCRQCGRDPKEITLVAVTKFAQVPAVQEALACGITDIGENKVQAAREKFAALPGARVRRHLIGHLQTNKVKPALELFDMIQSVDSPRLAAEIQRQAQARDQVMDILIQVDCSGEEQKFGVPKAELLKFIDGIVGYKNIRVQGLMTIAPLTEDTSVIRQCFRDLRLAKEKVLAAFPPGRSLGMRYLSMGMTHDYRIAIEEGANMLRVGSAIFADS